MALDLFPKRTRANLLSAGVILVLACFLALPGCGNSVGATAQGSTAESDVSQEEVPRNESGGEEQRQNVQDTPPEPRVFVRVGSFERRSISSVLRVYATLEAVNRADVYPEISGVVEKVLAREGDSLKKGDPVVQLRQNELRLTVETKKVLWEQAKSRVGLAELSSKEFSETVSTKQLLVEKAKREFDRVQELYAESEDTVEGIISKEEYDAKRYAYEEAELQHSTSKIQKQKAELDYTLAMQTERQSHLEYQTALFQLSRTQLSTPIDGAITFLELEPGELVGPTMKVFSVADVEELEAKLFVPQRELAHLKKGQDVRIVPEVFPDRVFKGTVEVVNPVVDSDSGMVRVIVGVNDPSAAGFLRPGMFINGEVVLETYENALLVRKTAILYENQEAVLYLVRDGVARRYTLKTGLSEAEHVQVLELTSADGERLDKVPDGAALVVLGQDSLKDGSPVEVDQSQ